MFWIEYWFYKEYAKFIKLNSFHYVHWLNWSGKLHSLDSLMKYEKWKEYWFSHRENWAKRLLLMSFWTKIYFSWAHIVIIHSTAYQMCYQANPMYLISSWIKLHLNGPKTVLLIHLKKTKDLVFSWDPQDIFYFNINYLIVVYFTFIYFTTCLADFIDSFLKLYWITQIMYIFKLL